MSIDLAKLVVSMEASTAHFQREMEKVNNRLARFESRTHAAVRGINKAFSTLGVGLSVGALAAFVKSSANVVSEQRAIAESVGLTVSEFSALTYAARQNQLAHEELGRALTKVNGLLQDGANGSEKAEKELARYGITTEAIRSGSIGTEQALNKIADRFAAMPNGIEKSSAAVALFGERLGPRMVQFLNNGSQGLASFAAEAKKAGAVIDDNMAAAVARANDKLEAFAQTMQVRVLASIYEFTGLIQKDRTAEVMENNRRAAKPLIKAYDDIREAIVRLQKEDTDSARTRVQILERRERELLQQLSSYGMAPAKPGKPFALPPVAADGPGAKALEKERKAAEEAQKALEEYGREWHALVQERRDEELWDFEAEKKFSASVDQAARNIQSFTASMVDAAMAGENMGDAIVASLRRIAAELLTSMALQGLGNQFIEWGFPQLGAAIAGKRADGGPVTGGKSYLVGEEGPELFTPRVSGAIIPNDALGGGRAIEINNNIDARGADPASTANILRAMGALRSQIYEDIRRETAPV